MSDIMLAKTANTHDCALNAAAETKAQGDVLMLASDPLRADT